MVNKGIKLRLYPNKEQEKQLNNMFGNNRFLWNLLLEMQQVRYKLFGLSCMSAYTMDSLVTQLKKVYPFLKLSDSTAFQKLTKSFNTSYWNFIKDPHKYGMPKFKSKRFDEPAYTGKSEHVSVLDKRHIQLPKLGSIKTSKTGVFKDTDQIKEYTISRDTIGRYWVSFSVETGVEPIPLKQPYNLDTVHGIDVGIRYLAVLSDDTEFKPFDFRLLEKEIRKADSKYAKRKNRILKDIEKGLYPGKKLSDFKNLEKARISRAKKYDKLKNKRKDYLHKLTTDFANKYDVLIVENLNIKGMMKNHKLAKSIANAAWCEFFRMLEYKFQWQGKRLIKVSPHNTTQQCSCCGHIGPHIDLGVEYWTCEKCGTHHKRDNNAAKNIRRKGIPLLYT